MAVLLCRIEERYIRVRGLVQINAVLYSNTFEICTHIPAGSLKLLHCCALFGMALSCLSKYVAHVASIGAAFFNYPL